MPPDFSRGINSDCGILDDATNPVGNPPFCGIAMGKFMEENLMGRFITLGIVVLGLALVTGCVSKNSDMEGMQDEESMGSMQQGDSMKTDEAWIREEPVDVKALDTDQDGFVYQDQMCWNVIADEEGKCPKCGMILKKVSVDEAIQNLESNGFQVQ